MAQQHKFRKAKSLFATTLVNGIGTGTSEEIILSSATGLPTDTEVTLTFNRVDSTGNENTSDQVERITGIIDSSNLTVYTRSVDNTTEQEHSAGTVIEYIWNADDLNDLVDGILVEHDQDGTHNTDKVVDLDTAQTLTNKTLTTPVINGAVTGTMTPPLTFYSANFYAPEGFLLNGKIVPSVASDNLTVALKGLDGEDPSATNPIYVRIGDTVHSITGALSFTKNAGTNWFNAGSSELATKEIDYFVYLGYNATDGVVIGFSRVPYANEYDDFSTTSTERNYCAISTITNASSGDNYTIIGRFAATLSAGAGYTWSVPTFTNKNLIQRPIFNTRVLVYLPTYSGATSMTLTCTNTLNYVIRDEEVFLYMYFQGTTGGTASNTIYVTPPFVPLTTRYSSMSCSVAESAILGPGIVSHQGTLIYFRKADLSNFGLGTNRTFRGQGSYEMR